MNEEIGMWSITQHAYIIIIIWKHIQTFILQKKYTRNKVHKNIDGQVLNPSWSIHTTLYQSPNPALNYIGIQFQRKVHTKWYLPFRANKNKLGSNILHCYILLGLSVAYRKVKTVSIKSKLEIGIFVRSRSF